MAKMPLQWRDGKDAKKRVVDGDLLSRGARKRSVAGVREAFRNASFPRQWRQKKSLIRANHTSAGRPQEESMMSVAVSFPSEKNQGY